MASVALAVPNPGAAWQQVLKYWDLFATNTYNTWAWAYAHPSFYHQWTLTLGLPAGGSDTIVIIPTDVEWPDVNPLPYVVGSPGWRTILPTAYPDPLWDGNDPYTDYWAQVLPLRRDIVQKYTGVGASPLRQNYSGTRLGYQLAYNYDLYQRDLVNVIDATGLLFGTPTVDQVLGPPTDLIGASNASPFVSGGGGVSVDLTPVVTALNDIADQEVSYCLNQAGETWSVSSKVRAGP